MKTLLVYAKNYGKFPKNFINNVLRSCFNESCVALHRIDSFYLIADDDALCLKAGSDQRNCKTQSAVQVCTLRNRDTNEMPNHPVHFFRRKNQGRARPLLFGTDRRLEVNPDNIASIKSPPSNSPPAGFAWSQLLSLSSSA